jgi:hypothetical protein
VGNSADWINVFSESWGTYLVIPLDSLTLKHGCHIRRIPELINKVRI